MARAATKPPRPKTEGKRAKSPPPPQREPAVRRRVVLFRVVLASLLLLLAVAGLVGLHYWRFTQAPLVEEGARVTIVIPHDTPWPGVVKILSAQGVVRRPRYFDVWGRQHDLPPHVKAGTYVVDGPLYLDGLDAMLRKGGMLEGVMVTIPEGFTIFHIADRLEKLELANRREFLELARSEAMLREHDVPGESFEGYLFPDTYAIEKGTGAQQILERMHARWEQQWALVVSRHPDALTEYEGTYGFGVHELVTLASLIERETNHDPERGLIARVFLNRIDRGMKLQTDPTCVYGEETYREIPSPKRCKDRLSRYSTYVIEGLPPGPISAPGLASLEAALSPPSGSDAKEYLFFVARRDGSGSHHFTKTYEEHREGIRKFLKKK